jgi:hypothetical protein
MNKREIKKLFDPLVSGENSNLIQRVIFHADYTKAKEKVSIKQILEVLADLSVEQEKAIDDYLNDSQNI